MLAAATGLLGLTVCVSVGAASPPRTPGELTPDLPVRLTGDLHWSNISGETGASNEVIGVNKKHGLRMVAWWENKDYPCKFLVRGRGVATGEPRNVMDGEDLGCHGSEGDVKSVARTGEHEYITKVAVCLTDKNNTTKNKIKGMRAWGRVFDPNTRTLGGLVGPSEAEHAHCAEWSQAVSCPDGEVAQKIKVYYTPYAHASNRPAFARGVALGCRKIE